VSIKNVVKEKLERRVECEVCGKQSVVLDGGFFAGKIHPVGHVFLTLSVPVHGIEDTTLPHPRVFRDFCSYKCIRKYALSVMKGGKK